MASIKIKYEASTQNGEKGYLYYLITHNNAIRRIDTGYKVFPYELNHRSKTISIHTSLANAERKNMLLAMQQQIKHDKLKLNKIIAFLKYEKGEYLVDDIVRLFYAQKDEATLFHFMQEVASNLKKTGKIRTAETYYSTLRSFMHFRNGKDISLNKINSEIIMLYEHYLKSKGISLNTISFYMRILRATYNRAVEKGMINQCYPFRYVYTGIEKTLKRALPFNSIKQIKELDLSSNPSLDFAKDMFLFSFYTRGMSFIDMAYLRKTNLQDGFLIYYRHKTKQRLFIKWEACMQKIANKYTSTDSDFLLPIIKERKNERRQYENALHLVNHQLKKIAFILNLPIRLSMYVARHSWASIAKSKHIPISIISQAMGHQSETTTQIYLASLNNSTIDKANTLILKNL